MSPIIDGNAAPTGEVAQPHAEKITVYGTADGKPLALLPSDESVPVVGHAQGWVRVMLPSRRMLPSQSREARSVVIPQGTLETFVNRGTGWVKESDVDIKKGVARVAISRTDRRLYVVGPAGVRLASYPATIGGDVPNGPTYVSPGTPVAGGCVDIPPVQLAAQSETTDSYLGQSISPIFIAGPRSQCNSTAEEMADTVLRMVQLSPADAAQLSSFLQPGMEVDILGVTPSGQVAS